jgi:hypothetical protein
MLSTDWPVSNQRASVSGIIEKAFSAKRAATAGIEVAIDRAAIIRTSAAAPSSELPAIT